MQVVAVTESNIEQYNAFVITNNGSFLQAYEWGKWQDSLGRKTHRYILEHNGTIVMSAQFIEHTTPLGTYLYAPHGPVVVTGSTQEAKNNGLENLVSEIKKRFPKSLFIRLEPTFKLAGVNLNVVSAKHIQPPHTLLLDISKTPDKLLEIFHQKTRYNIRVAEKHNVRVEKYFIPDARIIDLIMQTSDRQHYKNHPREYIEKLWQFFSDSKSSIILTGYLACTKNKPAASAIMVDFGKTRMYLFGGSNYELRQYMAPYLLHWQAIQDAQKAGLKNYDFGAFETGNGINSGLMRFKMGFNPENKQFGGTWDIPNRKLFYSAYRILRKTNHLLQHLS